MSRGIMEEKEAWKVIAKKIIELYDNDPSQQDICKSLISVTGLLITGLNREYRIYMKECLDVIFSSIGDTIFEDMEDFRNFVNTKCNEEK